MCGAKTRWSRPSISLSGPTILRRVRPAVLVTPPTRLCLALLIGVVQLVVPDHPEGWPRVVDVRWQVLAAVAGHECQGGTRREALTFGRADPTQIADVGGDQAYGIVRDARGARIARRAG